jgi:hypothetical protein
LDLIAIPGFYPEKSHPTKRIIDPWSQKYVVSNPVHRQNLSSVEEGCRTFTGARPAPPLGHSVRDEWLLLSFEQLTQNSTLES